MGHVTQRPDEVSQLQASGGLGPIGAGVDYLSVDAGDGLGGLEVLLVSQADGMGQVVEPLAALELVAVVVGCDADFQESQFAGFVLDLLGDLFAAGLYCGLHALGGPASQHQAAVQLLVLFANLAHFRMGVPKGIGPIAGSALGEVDRFQRVLTGVPVGPRGC